MAQIEARIAAERSKKKELERKRAEGEVSTWKNHDMEDKTMSSLFFLGQNTVSSFALVTFVIA